MLSKESKDNQGEVQTSVKRRNLWRTLQPDTAVFAANSYFEDICAGPLGLAENFVEKIQESSFFQKI